MQIFFSVAKAIWDYISSNLLNENSFLTNM